MKIGFIGLGLMGEPMSLNLVKKSGHKVRVFDFDQTKVKLLLDAGAEYGESSLEIGKTCDIIFTMVPKSEHVKSVYDELLKVIKPNQILVEMSTIDPDVSIELSKKVKEKGAVMLDCPVVKSRPAAIEGKLGIYVGGDKKAFEEIKSLLLCMGENVIYLGENGRGLVMKLCHNALVAEIQNGVNEMLVLAEEFGIGIEDFAEAVSYGGASNFYLTAKLKSLKEQNFAPAFSLENMQKDIHCLLNLIQSKNIKLNGIENVKEIYDLSAKENLGKEDFSATIKTVKKIAKS